MQHGVMFATTVGFLALTILTFTRPMTSILPEAVVTDIMLNAAEKETCWIAILLIFALSRVMVILSPTHKTFLLPSLRLAWRRALSRRLSSGFCVAVGLWSATLSLTLLSPLIS
jgi:hypothetical protein